MMDILQKDSIVKSRLSDAFCIKTEANQQDKKREGGREGDGEHKGGEANKVKQHRGWARLAKMRTERKVQKT